MASWIHRPASSSRSWSPCFRRPLDRRAEGQRPRATAMTHEHGLQGILAIEGRARIDDLRQGTLDDEERSRAGATALRLRDSLPIIDRLNTRDVPGLASVVRGLDDVQLLVVDPLSTFV